MSEADESKLRLRRCKSVTRAEEIQSEEAKVRRSQPDRPCHRPRDSLFSWSSGFSDFTGFINWGFLLLGLGGVRLLLENFIKYGIRVDPYQWLLVLSGRYEGSSEYPSLILLVYSNVHILITLLIEKGIAIELISVKQGLLVQMVNLVLLVLLPVVTINVKTTGFSLIGATTVCFVYSIVFLKLWSYVQVNMWCRNSFHKSSSKKRLRRQTYSVQDLSNENEVPSENGCTTGNCTNKEIVQYPNNLTISDLFYFMFVPTLCYELNFPKTDRIRKRFLVKRILEVIVGCQVVLGLFQQWIIPSVKNSLIPFSNMDVAKATERLLKLAIPNHLLWLIWFYLFFHSFLNLLGELLHFADRNFYKDWWNANNLDYFWRNWNMPVHQWAVRHLYKPIIELGYSKTIASSAVFFISAFFHEYLVSVPLKTFKTWAFLGMMSQIPLSHVSRLLEVHCGPRWGNLLVWTSLIIGQPLCIMMYYHDYVITHFGEHLIGQFGKL